MELKGFKIKSHIALAGSLIRSTITTDEKWNLACNLVAALNLSEVIQIMKRTLPFDTHREFDTHVFANRMLFMKHGALEAGNYKEESP